MTDQEIRTLKIIYIAQAIGPTVFVGVAVYLAMQAAQQGAVPTDSELQTVRWLSVGLLAMVVPTYAAAGVLYRRTLESSGDADTSAPGQRIITAFIIRMALFEGVALFGIVVFLLAGMNGSLQAAPIYALTLLPYLFLLMFCSKTFPSKEYLAPVFDEVSRREYA